MGSGADSPDELIARLAEAQYGTVARRQLLAAGIGDSLIRSRVRRGHLRPRFRGVYAVGHSALSRRGIWMAAVLACGPQAVLSHSAAAALWGFGPVRSRVEVTRVVGRMPALRGVTVHRSRQLDQRQVAVRESIPVTTVERTVIDCAASMAGKQLQRLLVNADRTGLLSWPELADRVQDRSTVGGVSELRRAMRLVDPSAVETAAAGEIDFLAICADGGLPRPQVNALVADLRVDFLWPGERLVVEIDGYRYHRDRVAFEEDRRRDALLTAQGYRVLRFTYRMLRDHEDWVLAQVRNALVRI